MNSFGRKNNSILRVDESVYLLGWCWWVCGLVGFLFLLFFLARVFIKPRKYTNEARDLTCLLSACMVTVFLFFFFF